MPVIETIIVLPPGELAQFLDSAGRYECTEVELRPDWPGVRFSAAVVGGVYFICSAGDFSKLPPGTN